MTQAANGTSAPDTNGLNKHDASAPKRRHGGTATAADGPIEALTYRDPFGGVYKRSGSVVSAAWMCRSSPILSDFGLQVHLQRRWEVPPRRNDGWRRVRLRQTRCACEKEGKFTLAGSGLLPIALRGSLSDRVSNINGVVASCRKLWMSRPRSSFSAPARARRILATTLTTTRRFAAVM